MAETLEDEELLQIALNLASQAVDEEIAHHPELISQREILLKGKTKSFAHAIQQENDSLKDEISRASDLVKEYFATLPPDIYESLSLNEEAIKEDPNQTLQENMGVPESTMQLIYGHAIDLQNSENHVDASAIFKFPIVLNPLISDFWTALGTSQICQHSDQEALKSFKKGIEADPSNLRNYYFTAYTYHLLKDKDASLATIEEALKLTESPTYEEWEPILKEIQSLFTEQKESV